MLFGIPLLLLLTLDPEVNFLRAQALRAQATTAAYTEAADLLSALAADTTLDPLSRFRVELNLCSVYLEAGLAEAAAARLAKMAVPGAAVPSDQAAYLQIQALVARQNGELSRSRRLLREAGAIVQDPAEKIPLVNTAIAFALEDYEIAEAEEQTHRLREMLVAHPSPGILAAAPSFYLAQIHVARGDQQRAWQWLLTHLEEAGSAVSLPARHFQCELLEAMGKRKQAKALRRSIPATGAGSAWVSVKQLEAERAARRAKREPSSSGHYGKQGSRR